MTQHDKREKYLDGWAITILHDHAYLSGLDENDINVEEKEIRNIVFIEAELTYIKAAEDVESTAPGFQVTTDSGIYWCDCLSADSYTIADTAAALSRIMPDDVISRLTNPKEVQRQLSEMENDYRRRYGISSEYDGYSFDDVIFD